MTSVVMGFCDFDGVYKMSVLSLVDAVQLEYAQHCSV